MLIKKVFHVKYNHAIIIFRHHLKFVCNLPAVVYPKIFCGRYICTIKGLYMLECRFQVSR